VAPDVESADDGVSAIAGLMEHLTSGVALRLSNMAEVGGDWNRLLSNIEAAGGGSLALKLILTIVISVAAATFVGRAWLKNRAWLTVFMSTLAAATVGLIAAHMMGSGIAPLRITLVGAAIAVALANFASGAMEQLIRPANARRANTSSLDKLRLIWRVGLAWALAGAAVNLALRAYGAGAGLRDLVATVIVSLPALTLFVVGALVYRKNIATVVAGRRPRAPLRANIARLTPPALAGGLVMLVLAGQLTTTLGGRIAPLALIATAMALIVLPFADAHLRAWADHGLQAGRLSAVRVALRRTARPATHAVALGMMLAIWTAPVLAALGTTTDQAFALAVKIAIVGLGASFVWNVVIVAEQRSLFGSGPHADDHDTEDGAPRSRLETLAPMISAVVRWTIAVLAILSVLVILGINVWPLVTGLSVFGIAIGFGSQALVKDVVSGLFFLVDDAFRKGEYIEISGAKGVVEKISVRSVSLRHQRGALATIPYGAIGRVQNHSRDWVIEKLLFRVALETDVEQVRKLFKKIGIELAADPELADDMLEPFKSQGIAELDDGTLVIRAKFKARAGRQSLIRRKALSAVHKAFLEAGVRSVAKPVMPGIKGLG
jgi:moderate conductance mechanosensitive channel